MDQKLMQRALQNRKADGLDITILLGVPPGTNVQAQEEAKELGMAPDANPLGSADDAKAVALGNMAHQDNMMPGGEITEQPNEAEKKATILAELAKLGKGFIGGRLADKKK